MRPPDVFKGEEGQISHSGCGFREQVPGNIGDWMQDYFPHNHPNVLFSIKPETIQPSFFLESP